MKTLDERFGVTEAPVWISTEPDDPDAPAFFCLNFDPNSPEVMAIKERITRPVRKLANVGGLTPKKSREVAVQVFIDASLRDWKNVATKEDGELVYSPENALKIFTRFDKLFQFIAAAATDDERFRDLENDAKN